MKKISRHEYICLRVMITKLLNEKVEVKLFYSKITKSGENGPKTGFDHWTQIVSCNEN